MIEDIVMFSDESFHATEAWMKPVEALWQNTPLDFDAEMDFNREFSQHYPHCCICALFVPFKVKPGNHYS